MRSVGKRNIKLIQDITCKEAKKDIIGIEARVIKKLPVELWAIWGKADQEIRQIIDEIIEVW